MPARRKRKIRGENNTGLYQVQPTLSTTALPESGLDRWLRELIDSNPGHLWLLSGPVGAGKTTLVRHLARLLGVRSAVTSPTFALQKIHPLRGQAWRQLVHIDMYRLKNNNEVAALELKEYLADQRTLIVVEWPERLPDVKWGPHIKISLVLGRGGLARKVTVARLG